MRSPQMTISFYFIFLRKTSLSQRRLAAVQGGDRDSPLGWQQQARDVIVIG